MNPTYGVRFTAQARRALSEDLPEKVAAAVFEFIVGPLAQNPHQVGRQLKEPLYPLYSARRGDYRVIYSIVDESVVIEIISIAHRRDAYR